ncbi:DUF3313 family protein [Teredinibacter purpureus]|uniref:DUF3313 family protein n=1 Tax=Teredinibacter purpureus TaxID=2731756 RepID=UPI0005F876F4|nr:DUF3313 family protein [Teredinibacter purpureus]
MPTYWLPSAGQVPTVITPFNQTKQQQELSIFLRKSAHFTQNCYRDILATILVFAAITANAQQDTTITYVRPGVEFSQFTQFIITPLDVSDMKLVPPPWVKSPKKGQWALSDESTRFIRGLYISSITKGIHSGGKFNAVTVPTAQTIQLDIKISRLTPWTPKNDNTETLGSGEIKFEAALRDALTGDLIAIIEGQQQVGSNYQENTRLTKEHNLQKHFEGWGKKLSDALSRQHQKL